MEVIFMFEGSRLKEQRTALRLSQESLAERLDVHVNTIRRWEQDRQAPDAKKLDSLAEALHTTVAYLSGETDNPQREDDNKVTSPVVRNMAVIKDPSFVKEGNFIGNKNVLVYEVNGERFILPATKENQSWFRDFMMTAMSSRAVVSA